MLIKVIEYQTGSFLTFPNVDAALRICASVTKSVVVCFFGKVTLTLRSRMSSVSSSATCGIPSVVSSIVVIDCRNGEADNCVGVLGCPLKPNAVKLVDKRRATSANPFFPEDGSFKFLLLVPNILSATRITAIKNSRYRPNSVCFWTLQRSSYTVTC